MWDKIKQYWQIVAGIVVAFFAAIALYAFGKSKKIDGAIEENQKNQDKETIKANEEYNKDAGEAVKEIEKATTDIKEDVAETEKIVEDYNSKITAIDRVQEADREKSIDDFLSRNSR
jgi:hypothetical protein